MQANQRARQFLEDYFVVIRTQKAVGNLYRSQLRFVLTNEPPGAAVPGSQLPGLIVYTDVRKLAHYRHCCRALEALQRHDSRYYCAVLLRFRHLIYADVSPWTVKDNARTLRVPVPTYKTYVRLGLAWLDGCFEFAEAV